MKKLTPESRDRMIRALRSALRTVRTGTNPGLCAGIEDAFGYGSISMDEADYLIQWISRMLGGYGMFFENWHRAANEIIPYKYSPIDRYERRKPWVKWMIRHLKETT